MGEGGSVKNIKGEEEGGMIPEKSVRITPPPPKKKAWNIRKKKLYGEGYNKK